MAHPCTQDELASIECAMRSEVEAQFPSTESCVISIDTPCPDGSWYDMVKVLLEEEDKEDDDDK